MTRVRPSLALVLALVLFAGAMSSAIPVECCATASSCCPDDGAPAQGATPERTTPERGPEAPCSSCECCAALRVAPPPVPPVVVETIAERRIEAPVVVTCGCPVAVGVFRPPKLRQV